MEVSITPVSRVLFRSEGVGNLKPPKSDPQLARVRGDCGGILARMNELWLQQLNEQRRRADKESRRGAGDDNSSVFCSLNAVEICVDIRNLGSQGHNKPVERYFFDAMERLQEEERKLRS